VYDYHTICGECAAIGPLFGEAAEQADASWNEEWRRKQLDWCQAQRS
jgi:hypothetical protein